jgi:hypothetical protein
MRVQWHYWTEVSITTPEAILENVEKGIFQVPLALSRLDSDFEVYQWSRKRPFQLLILLD